MLRKIIIPKHCQRSPRFCFARINRETVVGCFRRSAFPCFPFLNSFPCHTSEITTVVDRRPRLGREPQTPRRYFTYPLSVQLLAHSFAHTKNATPFLSRVSALFAKNHPGAVSLFCYPLASRRRERAATRFSLLPCFFSSVHYNRCASMRRKNELPPAIRRNPHRLRAPLLGRQHHGNFRAPFLLRRFRFSRQLSPRKAEFSYTADRHARWNLWRYGLVSRDFWRRDRGPSRFPPRALAGLLDSCYGLFFARLHRRAVACPRPSRGSACDFRWLHSDFARARHFHGQALRGGNYRARFQRKRSLHRLLHLLHHGEHWRCFRPVRRFLGASPSWRGKCFSRCRSQRLPDVLRRPDFLSRTQARQRRSAAQSRSPATFTATSGPAPMSSSSSSPMGSPSFASPCSSTT